jgi:hypothetical protein
MTIIFSDLFSIIAFWQARKTRRVILYNLRQKSDANLNPGGLDLVKSSALVRYYFVRVRGAGAAFFCTTHMGKLLQHKLMRVQCTKKVPEYRYSLYCSTGIRFKQVILKGFLRLHLQPVQLIWQNNPPAFTTIFDEVMAILVPGCWRYLLDEYRTFESTIVPRYYY